MLLTCASAALPARCRLTPTRAQFAADVPARTRQNRIFIFATSQF